MMCNQPQLDTLPMVPFVSGVKNRRTERMETGVRSHTAFDSFVQTRWSLQTHKQPLAATGSGGAVIYSDGGPGRQLSR